ncbi:MAG TPA: D-2-hydroxyacid dehydrogenase [Candidatus Sulfotelmatobacter sp.]
MSPNNLLMKLLIVVHHRFDLWNAPGWFAPRLRSEFPEIEIVHSESYDGIEDDLASAEVFFTFLLRPEQFATAKKLRWLHAPTAAVHQLLFPEFVNSDVLLTNAREVHAPVVAEHVIAMIFALAKKIPEAALLQQKHLWGQSEIWHRSSHPREVNGATLGLVGLGSIGRHVAERASGLGMRIIAVREHSEKELPHGVQQVFAPPDLDQLLSQSDYVVLAAPLTAATRGLMNAERFAAMKSSACLINVGRGPLIDETALATALRSNQIAGAALDVFEQEPLPSESPLWDLPNLLITPHTAALTDKLWERHYALLSENLRRYVALQPLLDVVDKQKGY